MLIFLFRSAAIAQTDTIIYLYISDTTSLLSIGVNADSSLTPVFIDSGTNSIIAPYKFSVFQQAYPQSRFPFMHKFYRFKVTSGAVALANALTTAYPIAFPHYEVHTPTILADYYPNDYSSIMHPCSSCSWLDYSWYLDYIHAQRHGIYLWEALMAIPV